MNLYDLMDPLDVDDMLHIDNSKLPIIENICNISLSNDNKLSTVMHFDSLEYLKYSNKYKYDKLIIANVVYKTQNKRFYDQFHMLNLINTTTKYKLEYYIKQNYKLANDFINHYSDIIKLKFILPTPVKFFTKTKIHDKLKLHINISNPTIRGTLYDKAISHVYDSTIDFISVTKSCISVPELGQLIQDKKITTSAEVISELWDDQLTTVKNVLDNIFVNMSPCKIIFSHEKCMYGYPDFIADNWIIDIKTSMKTILTVHNFLQVVGYAICSGIKNICLYDIENGYLYTGTLNTHQYDQLSTILFKKN